MRHYEAITYCQKQKQTTGALSSTSDELYGLLVAMLLQRSARIIQKNQKNIKTAAVISDLK